MSSLPALGLHLPGPVLCLSSCISWEGSMQMTGLQTGTIPCTHQSPFQNGSQKPLLRQSLLQGCKPQADHLHNISPRTTGVHLPSPMPPSQQYNHPNPFLLSTSPEHS